MSFNNIKHYYEKVYEHTRSESFPLDENRYLAWFRNLPEQVADHPKSLDIGCGVGFVCDLLEKKGYQVFGNDISNNAITIAKQRVPQGKFFRTSESGILDFPNNHFDLITCLGVLEHIEQPEQTVKDAYRILKNEGYAIFVVPNAWHPYFWFGGTNQIYEKPQSVDSWSRLFTSQGFHVESIRKDPGPSSQQGHSLAKRFKLLLQQFMNQLPTTITYQFVFLLKK